MGATRPARLLRIVAAYTANQLGWWFALVALSLGVYNHTHNTLAVASVFVVAVLPALLAPAVVARVEASPRRGGLAVLSVIEAVCAAGLAALMWSFSLPGVLVLVAIDGSVAYAARALVRSEAARAGEVAEFDRELSDRALSSRGAHRANAALNISLALCGVSGPALASLAVKGFGAPVALLIDGACFLASGVLLVDLTPHVEEAAMSVRARVAAARDYLRGTTTLRAAIVTQSVALIFFYCPLPVEVAYATSSLHAGDLGYGALLATWGVGQIVGSLIFARVGGGLWVMVWVGTLAVGLAYIGYALAPTLLIACIAALPGGIGNGIQWASFVGVVQGLTPGRLLGRIMGVIEAARSVAPPLGYALGGALALASPRIALFVAGLAAALITIPFVRIGAARAPAVEPSDTPLVQGTEQSQHGPGVRGVAP